jgi:microsomal epoxide hydrolase
MVTFYWVTDTLPRSMWPYRVLTGIVGAPIPAMPFSLTKPFGFSSFPIEQSVVPQKWAEQLFPNLVLFSKHSIVSDSHSHVISSIPFLDANTIRVGTSLPWSSL